MKKILLIIMSFFVLNLNVLAEEDFAPNGKSAILVDNLSGKVLYEKNADEKLAPASMTKLASMLMVMEAIDNGNLKFEDKVTKKLPTWEEVKYFYKQEKFIQYMIY